jgi:hypothetical protein
MRTLVSTSAMSFNELFGVLLCARRRYQNSQIRAATHTFSASRIKGPFFESSARLSAKSGTELTYVGLIDRCCRIEQGAPYEESCGFREYEPCHTTPTNLGKLNLAIRLLQKRNHWHFRPKNLSDNPKQPHRNSVRLSGVRAT